MDGKIDTLILKSDFIATCKVCEKDFPILRWASKAGCIYCNKYTIVYADLFKNLNIVSESLFIDNYFLVYSKKYKKAWIIEKTSNGFKNINEIKIEELTHDIAFYWLEKLKTYVAFQ